MRRCKDSSTLAAIVDLINELKHYHIVTIEDPIEYLHSHKNCTINQREVGHDTRDFPSALRVALRAWFAAELNTAGGQAGLAERVFGAGQALWPLAVVASCQYAASTGTMPSHAPA